MIFKGFINWFFFLPTDVGTFSYPHTIAYCCPTVYNSFLKSNLLHQNLSHSSLNLLIRQNNFKLCQESSFVYQNKFNGILKFVSDVFIHYQVCLEVQESAIVKDLEVGLTVKYVKPFTNFCSKTLYLYDPLCSSYWYSIYMYRSWF